MKEIRKYPFEPSAEIWIEMPEGADVLDCQVQNRIPTLWAMVDPLRPPVRRLFRTFGTGRTHAELGDGWWVGSLQMHDGAFVLHVFDHGTGGGRVP